MAGNHVRNTAPMLTSLRCRGHSRHPRRPCMAPAVGGSELCRMHGGSGTSGAPDQNRNAERHGLWAQRQRMAGLMQRGNDVTPDDMRELEQEMLRFLTDDSVGSKRG